MEKRESYIIFKEIFESVFQKLNRSKGTIFENMDAVPQADAFYKIFLESQDYETYLSLEGGLKSKFLKHWILENVYDKILEAVEYKLLTEHEVVPLTAEIKIRKSQDVLLQESATTLTLGSLASAIGVSAGVAGMVTGAISALSGAGLILGGLLAGATILSDTDKQTIQNGFKALGEYIGAIAALKLPGTFKDEILALADAQNIVDEFEECVSMTGFNPKSSNVITRLIDRIMNNKAQYDYTRCVGNKFIDFYVHALESYYNLLEGVSGDRKIIDAFSNNVKRGNLDINVFKNISRMSKRKEIYTVTRQLIKMQEALDSLLDALIHSTDSEFARIGYDLTKEFENRLKELYKNISGHGNYKPAMNRIDERGYKDRRDHRDHRDHRERRDNRDNRAPDTGASRHNPF